MKKLLLYLVMVLLAVLISCEIEDGSGPTDPTDPGEPPETEDSTIVVRTPNAGDSLAIESSYIITWTSGLSENLNIDYSIDDGNSWRSVATNTEDDGTYIWNPVPITISDSCKIKVATLDGVVEGLSNGNFSIVAQTSKYLELTSPSGGEVLVSNSEYTIYWRSASVENISISFSSNGGNTWTTIVQSYSAANTSYIWAPIPEVLSSDCLIKLVDVSDAAVLDINSSPFSIIEEKNITVTAPNGGDNWITNSAYMITWFSSLVENVRIEYTTNNGVSWTTITDNVPSNGLYQWEPIPNTPSNNAKIRITNVDGGSPSDESDGVFSIAPEEFIKVVYPNGGEQFQAGSSQYITWQSSIPDQPGDGLLAKNDEVSKKSKISKKGKLASSTGSDRNLSGVDETESILSVKIEYSINNGANWELVTESTPNNGSYLWDELPTVNSALCIIRISDADDNMPFDLSDNSFEITDITVQEQTLRLISPNGGEEYEAGTTQNITWEATLIESFDLEFTTDNGSSWILIASGVQGSAFEWGLPIDINSPLTKVRVSDALDDQPFDVSDAAFTVKPAESVVVLRPTSGEVYEAGQAITIEWIATGIENVGIQYTTTNGLGSFNEPPFYTVTASTPNTGSLETSFSIPSSQYYVMVYDASDAAPQARSIGTFSVTGQIFGIINVLKPAGGDTLFSGTTHEIKWNSQYVENVKIEFSLNFGATWETIVESTPSDGSYIWGPVPDITSDLCALRISDAARGEVSAISGEPFVIARQVQQIAGEPASIYLVSQTYGFIGVTESGSPETSQITFEVQDSSGLPIDFAHAVEVSFIFGARPGGGEFLAPLVAETDENGRVNVNLSSGTIAGSVQVMALINHNGATIMSRPVNIAIHGGLPNDDHFAIGTDQLNYPYYHVLNGIGSVTAVVGDQYSNPVKPGTVVYFSTEGGIVQGSNLTDDLGRTSVTLVSGSPLPNDPIFGPGFFYVTGETIDENDLHITTNTLVLYSGYPTVSISPTSFNIPNGGSQSFTYVVRDGNGNPLAPGNRYSVTVETGGDAAAAGQTFILMPDTQFGSTTFSFTVSDTKPDEVKPAGISVTVSIDGPNGLLSGTVNGTTN